MERKLNNYAVLKQIEGTPWIAFSAFERFPELVCGFSTRLGGVSSFWKALCTALLFRYAAAARPS